VSAALVGFGLAAARQLRAGRSLEVGRAGAVTVLAGGLLVVLSFTADAGRIAAGGLPTTFLWPVFVAGMALAAWGARATIRVPGSGGAGAASAKDDRGRGPQRRQGGVAQVGRPPRRRRSVARRTRVGPEDRLRGK
jgi:hypothetical protein